MREVNMDRTRKGIKKCAEWLLFCISTGWKKEQLDALEELWWEYHDENGNFKSDNMEANTKWLGENYVNHGTKMLSLWCSAG